MLCWFQQVAKRGKADPVILVNQLCEEQQRLITELNNDLSLCCTADTQQQVNLIITAAHCCLPYYNTELCMLDVSDKLDMIVSSLRSGNAKKYG